MEESRARKGHLGTHIVIQIMMLNLLTAVVLEGYASTNKEHTGAITSFHFNELIKQWVYYDPNATGWIDVQDIIFLVFKLNEPLGKKNQFDQEVRSNIESI